MHPVFVRWRVFLVWHRCASQLSSVSLFMLSPPSLFVHYVVADRRILDRVSPRHAAAGAQHRGRAHPVIVQEPDEGGGAPVRQGDVVGCDMMGWECDMGCDARVCSSCIASLGVLRRALMCFVVLCCAEPPFTSA